MVNIDYTEDELVYNLKELKNDLAKVMFRLGMLMGMDSNLKEHNVELSEETIKLITDCKTIGKEYLKAQEELLETGVFKNAKQCD